MGQQQILEQKATVLRRTILTLTIAVLMAAMVALGADPALAKTHSKTNVSSSGNGQNSWHENDQGGEPAGGGGAVVKHANLGGDMDHSVVTPSGSENAHSHDNVQQ